jgi:hypothetical protein
VPADSNERTAKAEALSSEDNDLMAQLPHLKTEGGPSQKGVPHGTKMVDVLHFPSRIVASQVS